MKPRISIIAAVGRNRELGKDNKLIWHIPEDLKRFRKITSGHPIIMGRKTFESIGKPLPHRMNIIVTRNVSYKAEGCVVKSSVKEAVEQASSQDENEIFIIGGGQLYCEAVKFVDRLYLTIIDSDFDADVYFPDFSHFNKVVSEEKSSNDNFHYRFLVLERC